MFEAALWAISVAAGWGEPPGAPRPPSHLWGPFCPHLPLRGLHHPLLRVAGWGRPRPGSPSLITRWPWRGLQGPQGPSLLFLGKREVDTRSGPQDCVCCEGWSLEGQIRDGPRGAQWLGPSRLLMSAFRGSDGLTTVIALVQMSDSAWVRLRQFEGRVGTDRPHTSGPTVRTAQLPGPSPDTEPVGARAAALPFKAGAHLALVDLLGSQARLSGQVFWGDVRLQGERAQPGRRVRPFTSHVTWRSPGCYQLPGPGPALAAGGSWDPPHLHFPCVCLWGPRLARAGYPALLL